MYLAPSAPMINGIVSVLMPHIRLVSISKSLYYYYYYYYYYYCVALSDLP